MLLLQLPVEAEEKFRLNTVPEALHVYAGKDAKDDLGPAAQPRLPDGALTVRLGYAGYRDRRDLKIPRKKQRGTVFPADGKPIRVELPWGPWLAYQVRETWLVPCVLGLVAGVLLVTIRGRRPVEVKKEENIGRVISGLRLEKLIGQGGMARVYLARATSKVRGKPVAVKLLNNEACRMEEFRTRFRREVKVCRKLSHPHIVSLFDWGETEDGCFFLILEFLSGKDLEEIVKKGPRPSNLQIADWLLQAASALAHLHAHELVHRDVKPGNMIVTDAGLKLLDFGVAGGHDLTRATLTGTALGTPAYMAPEQLNGVLHPQTDQYALGLVAYELLSGRRPFLEENPALLVGCHLKKVPPPLKDFRPDLDELVYSTVDRMLLKAPEDRFPDILTAAETLRYALGSTEQRTIAVKIP